MSVNEAQCTYNGRVFSGMFEAVGLGDDEVISVRYHGDQPDAPTGGVAATIVAKILLEELVIRAAIADKVRAGEDRIAATG